MKGFVKDKKYRVLLLSLGPVVNMRRGGAEKVLADMANALVRRNYSVSVLFCDEAEGDPGFSFCDEVCVVNAFNDKLIGYFERKPWKNIRSIALTKEVRRKNREKLEQRLKAKLIGIALKKMGDFDLCICFQVEAVHLFKSDLSMKVPVITMLHGCPEDSYISDALVKYKSSVEKSDAVHVLLPSFVPSVKSRLPEVRVEVIPNVAPNFGRRQSSLENEVIVSVGRLSHTKRPELLIKAFALLKDEFPSWKCEWWGDFVSTKTLLSVQKLIADCGLECRFCLRGSTNRVEQELQKASIFAFPTQWEGFSLAMAEAMAMGLPVVGCKDCSSLRSMIKEGVNGFLTDPNPEAYAAKLALLMQEKSLRQELGRNGKEEMLKYDESYVWEKWDNLIQHVVQQSE